MKGRVKNSYFELRIPAELGQNGFKMELEAFDFGKPLKLKWIKSNSGSLSFRFQNHIMVFFKSNFRLVIFRSNRHAEMSFLSKVFFFCFSFHTLHMPDQHNLRNYVSSCSPDYYQDTLRKNILTGWRGGSVHGRSFFKLFRRDSTGWGKMYNVDYFVVVWNLETVFVCFSEVSEK